MTLSPDQQNELITTLQQRFEKHPERHPDILWDAVQARLMANAQKLGILYNMESTGGEPDVVAYDNSTGEYTFFDCSTESPIGRRSVCYDTEALLSRKKHPPHDSAIAMAERMGFSLLTEDQYRFLQQLGTFDNKTSSWIYTPADIREVGGALFADFRYGHVFVYHNGADSYYAARGFRGAFSI